MFRQVSKEWSCVLKEMYHQFWFQKPKVYQFFSQKYYKQRKICSLEN